MNLTTRILVAFLLSLLLASTFLFIRDITDIRGKGPIHPRNPLGIVFSGSRLPPGLPAEKDIAKIDTWMTFRYINLSFHLPEEYLKDTLSIANTRYPDIPLRSYIRLEKLEKKDFLEKVQEAVRTYIRDLPKPQ